MSSALAIAGVTAVLRDLLNDGMINNDVTGATGNNVTVTAMPPDRIPLNEDIEASRLNLFLHQVTPNTGWRNEGLPSRDTSGRQRLSNPPLALNLHYLVTAYSNVDLHGEILLGYAMQLLHENPVLSRKGIRKALNPSPDVGAILPPALRALSASGLAEQIEQIKITPEYLNSEEISKLWSATQSHYRPTAAYQVSVVLIESTNPVSTPLPVLTRGKVEQKHEESVIVNVALMPHLPTIEKIVMQNKQPTCCIGDTIRLTGHYLKNTNCSIVINHEHFDKHKLIPTSMLPQGDKDDGVQFEIPSSLSEEFPVGVYQISAHVRFDGDQKIHESNRLALTLAPQISNLPLSVARNAEETVVFSLKFTPALHEYQTVSLLLGQREVFPTVPEGAFANGQTLSELKFTVNKAPVGNHLVRLRIDGIDSAIVDRSVTPPVFLNQRIEIL